MSAFLKIKRKGQPADTSNQSSTLIAPVKKNQIGLTKKAANRISHLVGGDPALVALRLAIKGGGCSGLSIHYSLIKKDEITPKDHTFSKDEAYLVIDTKSLSFLGGSTVDCKEYLGSFEFFLVNNPNEKQCSCGKSFSM